MRSSQKKIKELISKIEENNLLLLTEDERNSVYYLQKLYDWQIYFYDTEWLEFYEEWDFCERCKTWKKGQCICYTR